MADTNNAVTGADGLEDNVFEIEKVICDGEMDGEKYWLVKWKDFPLDECTWQALDTFNKTDTIHEYELELSRLPSEAAREDYREHVNAEFNAALNARLGREEEEREQQAREQELREKRLLAKARRTRFVISSSDEEDDVDGGRVSRRALKSDEPAAPDVESGSEDSGPLANRRSSHVRAARTSPLFESDKPSRKPPLDQSDCSTDGDSDAESGTETSEADSEDSLIAECRRKGNPRRLAAQKRTTRSTDKRKTATARSASSTDKDSSASTRKSTQQTRASKPALPVQSTSLKNATGRNHAVTAASNGAQKGPSRPAAGASARSAMSHPPLPNIRRRGPGANFVPIRMTIKRTTAPSKKDWQNSDRLYNTLMMRHNAQKRSNREVTPDIRALEFVNLGGAPAGPSKPAVPPHQRPDENVYGRRDYGPRRPSYDEEQSVPEQTAHPEINKIPMTCWEWRNGSCQRGVACMYLHEATHPLVLSPIDGSVPPKYRKQPLTCYWYMKNPEGCKKSDAECLFAHKNTGLLPDPKGSAPVPIGPDEIPLTEQILAERVRTSERPRSPVGERSPRPERQRSPDRQLRLTSPRPHESRALSSRTGDYKNADPPLTCYHYMRNKQGCRFSAEDCRFTHHNTGWLARLDGPPIQLDRYARPVSARIDHATANSPIAATGPRSISRADESRVPQPERSELFKDPSTLTCWYWYNNGWCNKSAAECRFQHYETGQVAEPPGYSRRLRNRDEPAGTSDSPIEHSLTSLGPLPTRGFPSTTGHTSGGVHLSLTEDVATGRTKTTDATANALGSNASNLHGPGHLMGSIAPTAVMAPPPAPKPNAEQPGNKTSQPPVPPTGAQRTRPQLELRIADSELVPSSSPTLGSAFPTPAASTATVPPVRVPCAQMEQIIAKAYNLDFDMIFAPNVDFGRIQHLERRAFLVFNPQQHIEEVELITRWLMMHHVAVYNLWVDGSWNHFTQQILDGGSGVIIVHPEFERFWAMKDFALVLGANVRIWSVGYQMSEDCDAQDDPDIAPHETGCIEIFPQGGMILVTEDVFDKAPAEAVRIVELFVDKVNKCRAVEWGISEKIPYVDNTAQVYDAAVVWRLVVRPELMDWTFSVNEASGDREDEPDWQARYKLYELLSKHTYIYQDDGTAFDEMPTDYYPIISEHRDCAAPYYEVREKGGVAALNDFMVAYTQREVIRLRREYRHFYVVCTEPEKVDWADKWQNIREVITPKRCIQELEKDSWESLFNFHEWDLPPKADIGPVRGGMGMDGAQDFMDWVVADGEKEEEERGRSQSRRLSSESVAMDTDHSASEG